MFKVVMVLLAAAAAAQAEFIPFPICTNGSEQSNPAVDGDVAVWQDKRSGNYDIVGRVLPDGNEISISVRSFNQTVPAISGNWVVWDDDRDGNHDIYAYDIAAKQEWPVCLDLNTQTVPDIAGSIVVWQDNRGGNDDIYGYNLDTKTEFPIYIHPANQISPCVSGHYVVWADDRNSSTTGYDIYAIDLNNLAAGAFAVCTVAGDQLNPDMSGSAIVWQDPRSTATGTDIYGCDLSGGGEVPISVLNESQNSPAIAGKWIVWRDNRNKTTTGYDIYAYNRQSLQTEPVCTSTGSQAAPAVSSRYIIWQDAAVGNGNIIGTVLPIEASITLLSPNGGQSLNAANPVEVSWSWAGPVGAIRIEISPDAGQSWQLVQDNIPNTGFWSGLLPAGIHSQNCLLRVGDRVAAAVSDTSDAVFTVYQCAASLSADITGDCRVDLEDFAEMAEQWLGCGNSFDPQCSD